MSVCRFCEISAGLSVEPYNRVVFESKNFFVVPSLGSFIDNWFLICSKGHFLSLKEMGREVLLEFETVKRHMVQLLESEGPGVAVFEHGPCLENTMTGCGVDHCHVHVVFIGSLDLVAMAKSDYPGWKWNLLSSWKEIHKVNQKMSYIAIQSGDDIVCVAEACEFGSQVVRKILAKATSVLEYDWKKEPLVEATENAIQWYLGKQLVTNA